MIIRLDTRSDLEAHLRAKIFIASSVEGRPVAEAVQALLERDADSTIWHQGFFELSKGTLEDLVASLDEWDFGIFVFSPDDILKFRDHTYTAVRDNVLLELGLFIGRLGRSRAIIIQPRDPDLKIPSDLFGITPATYDGSRNEMDAALGPAATQIRKHITKTFMPRPGLYVMGEFKCGIGSGGWHRYAGNTGSVSAFPDRVRLGGSNEAGFEFPDFGVSCPANYVLFRVRRPANLPVSLYVAFHSPDSVTHVCASTSLKSVGWGSPRDEFRLPLTAIPVDEWYSVIIATASLHDRLNQPTWTISFKMRAPLEVSHIWCTDDIADIPASLRNGKDGRPVNIFSIPADFPLVEILQPRTGARVGSEESVSGVVADPDRFVRVYVHPGDGCWYGQELPSQSGHNWTARCFFGDQSSAAGDQFRVIAISSNEPNLDVTPKRELPAEGDRSRTITVIRS